MISINIQSNFTASLQDLIKKWQNLSIEEFLKAYGAEIISGRSDLLAVCAVEPGLNPVIAYSRIEAGPQEIPPHEQRSWTCDETFTELFLNESFGKCLTQQADGLKIENYLIDHCYSRLQDETCQLQIS